MSNRTPVRLAQRYYRQINQLVREDAAQTYKAFREEIIPHINSYRRIMQQNSSLQTNNAMDEIRRILQRIRWMSTESVFNEGRVRDIATTFVLAVNRRQKTTFSRVAAGIAGIDPTRNELWLRAFLVSAIEENVAYIKTIPIDYHNKIETIVNQGVRRGISISDMGKDIAEQGKVSQARGEFIARDQLGSIHGDLTKARHQNMGLDSFRWVTSNDERVRDSHADFDGNIYTWKDGAINERGETVWPGTDYNCRCYAEPLEEELRDMTTNMRTVK